MNTSAADCNHIWIKSWVSDQWECSECTTPYVHGQPVVARKGDPDTSWEAAASTSKMKMTEMRRFIHSTLLSFGPLTDEGIWQHIKHSGLEHKTSPSGARTRRSELVRAGKVYDTDKRSKGTTGRRMILWAAK